MDPGTFLTVFYYFLYQLRVKTNKSINGKPVYERLGNKNMHLSTTNVKNYPTPWIMWAGESYPAGSNVGNIKMGPATLDCPENTLVIYSI